MLRYLQDVSLDVVEIQRGRGWRGSHVRRSNCEVLVVGTREPVNCEDVNVFWKDCLGVLRNLLVLG